MNHVCVTNYFDVWGNKKEGFEVNNQCHDYYTTKSKLETRKQILQFLKRINFLKKSVRENSIRWEDTESGAYLNDRNWMPICEVRIVDKETYDFYN
jgi:ribosomal protein L31